MFGLGYRVTVGTWVDDWLLRLCGEATQIHGHAAHAHLFHEPFAVLVVERITLARDDAAPVARSVEPIPLVEVEDVIQDDATDLWVFDEQLFTRAIARNSVGQLSEVVHTVLGAESAPSPVHRHGEVLGEEATTDDFAAMRRLCPKEEEVAFLEGFERSSTWLPEVHLIAVAAAEVVKPRPVSKANVYLHSVSAFSDSRLTRFYSCLGNRRCADDAGGSTQEASGR